MQEFSEKFINKPSILEVENMKAEIALRNDSFATQMQLILPECLLKAFVKAQVEEQISLKLGSISAFADSLLES